MGRGGQSKWIEEKVTDYPEDKDMKHLVTSRSAGNGNMEEWYESQESVSCNSIRRLMVLLCVKNRRGNWKSH